MVSKGFSLFAALTVATFTTLTVTPCSAEFKLISTKVKPGKEALCLSPQKISVREGTDKKATLITADGRQLSSVIRENKEFKSLRLTVNGTCAFSYREKIIG